MLISSKIATFGHVSIAGFVETLEMIQSRQVHRHATLLPLTAITRSVRPFKRDPGIP
jgi:hypothetical protein